MIGRVCLRAALLATAFLAMSAGESDLKQVDRRLEKINAGDTVRVVNAHGHVYARFGGYEPQVEILATSQRLESNLPALETRIEHDAKSNSLSIVVDFTSEVPQGTKSRDRIDIVLFVPHQSRLDVRTVDGAIEVKKLQSDLVASSVKGDIVALAVDGHLQLKSARGDIQVTLRSGATDRPQTIAGETGDISVHLWEDADFDAVLATSGEISTDFSLEIDHRRFEEPAKHARATIGEGGPQLTVESKQGGIKLLRLNKSFHPGEDR